MRERDDERKRYFRTLEIQLDFLADFVTFETYDEL